MNSCIRRHGGKSHLAKKIVALFPPRVENPNKPHHKDPGYLHYVEPYFGAGSVLFANNARGISEVVCDVDRNLMNFWNVLKDERLFAKFRRQAEATPVCDMVFEDAKMELETRAVGGVGAVPNAVEGALNFFIQARMSMSGRMKDFHPLTKARTRRDMNAEASAWLSAVEGLPQVHARLKRVVVLCDSALDVIKKQDTRRTLFYLDPPYLHETRTAKQVYEYEMTNSQHEQLLKRIINLSGYCLISGYPSDLYQDYLSHWDSVDFKIANSAASGKTKRTMTERVWANYDLRK